MFVRLNPELSIAGIQSALEANRIKPADLKSFGLVVHEPADRVYVVDPGEPTQVQ